MGTVIVALDKFKGSIDAAQATAALTRGLLRTRPDLPVRRCPVADGGDGTLDALVAAGFRRVPVTAEGPTGEPGDHELRRRGDTPSSSWRTSPGSVRLPGGPRARPRR